MNRDVVDLWQAFVAHDVVTVDFIGRDSLIQNKRASGRAKDLGDIEDPE